MRRGLSLRNCAVSSACSLPSSRSSNSGVVSVLMAVPRASTAIASMRTVWTASTRSPADPVCGAARIATSTTLAASVAASAAGRRLRGNTEADELFQIARLDLDEVLPRREPRERQVDLLNVGRGRRDDLQLAHDLAAPV